MGYNKPLTPVYFLGETNSEETCSGSIYNSNSPDVNAAHSSVDGGPLSRAALCSANGTGTIITRAVSRVTTSASSADGSADGSAHGSAGDSSTDTSRFEYSTESSTGGKARKRCNNDGTQQQEALTSTAKR